MGAVKISKGIYEYKGYRISNCGYYEPDHCIWWEAVDMKTGCADYHATTKKFLMEQIDCGFNLLKILLKSCFFEKRLPIFKQRGIM